MQMARNLAEFRTRVRELRPAAASLGLVPTMGALHAGHLSLVRASQRRCDATLVSIFVNPTQFAAGEDLSQYPRPLERDLDLLRDAGVDLVFLPPVVDVYPPGCSTSVRPPDVARTLEGQRRPTHFAGVATVVLKLFLMSQADVAFFGQKDYQQSLVVRHLVRDLNVPLQIEVCPIVRDPDGLALSSRNVYLDQEQRQIALSLNRTLQDTAAAIEQGDIDGRAIMASMTQSLIEAGVDEVDYAVIADADTLEILEQVSRPAVLLLAVRVGGTRLIDNWLLP